MAALVLALPLSLLAQDEAVRPVEARQIDGELRVGLSVIELADEAVRARLESGLPQVIAIDVEVLDARGARVAHVVRTDRVVFDLWQEQYRIEELLGSARRSFSVASLDEAIDATLTARALPLGRADALRDRAGEHVRLRFGAQLNPPTPESIHRIRRWLARPGGAEGRGDTFFGSFVGLFVNRSVTAADAEVRFVSEPLSIPERDAP